MSEIPPPLMPDQPSRDESDNDAIFLPFLLADAPRLQLDFISRHKALPQAHRDALREWLRGYNTRLLKWIHDNYGADAVRAADAMSRAAGQKINANQKLAQEKAERDLFDHLEKDFKDEK